MTSAAGHVITHQPPATAPDEGKPEGSTRSGVDSPNVPTSPRRRRRTRPWRLLVLLLVLGTAAYFVAVPMMAWSHASRVDATPHDSRPPDQPGTTYLLVGSDSREGLTKRERELFHTGKVEGARADTIMLLHTGRGPDLLMSIPRASLVDVPGHGTAMINSAYEYGGPELLVQTVEDATGLRVDDYIGVGIGGVVNVVDTLGGITICPDAPMHDRRANLVTRAGCQHADGRTALAYARSRHAQELDDLDRTTHQREVVSAVGSQALSPGTFLNPFHYWDVVLAGAESIQVGENVGPLAMANFALAMRHLAGSSGLTCGMPITGYSVNAVHWDTERADRLLELLRQDRTDEIDQTLCQASGLAPMPPRTS